MGIVLAGGEVRPGDPIQVELPPEPHRRSSPSDRRAPGTSRFACAILCLTIDVGA